MMLSDAAMRTNLLEIAEVAGWESLPLTIGVRAGGDEQSWRVFVSTAPADTIHYAHDAAWDRWIESEPPPALALAITRWRLRPAPLPLDLERERARRLVCSHPGTPHTVLGEEPRTWRERIQQEGAPE